MFCLKKMNETNEKQDSKKTSLRKLGVYLKILIYKNIYDNEF